MKKYYQFAGLSLEISISEDRMYETEGQLGPFRRKTVTDPHQFAFDVVESLEKPEGTQQILLPGLMAYRKGSRTVRYVGTLMGEWQNAYMRISHNGKLHQVQLRTDQFPGRIPARAVLNALSIEHLLLECGSVLLHSSFIVRNGQGILFTAPSGAGKSTQADLWHQHRRAEIINGDRAAICVRQERIYAAGVPFSGSSHYCENKTVPLAAVVYLAQAPVTAVHRLRGIQAFRRIWEGISLNTWDKEDVEQAAALVEQIAVDVPVLYMPCTPDESAVTALEEELKKLEQL